MLDARLRRGGGGALRRGTRSGARGPVRRIRLAGEKNYSVEDFSSPSREAGMTSGGQKIDILQEKGLAPCMPNLSEYPPANLQ